MTDGGSLGKPHGEPECIKIVKKMADDKIVDDKIVDDKIVDNKMADDKMADDKMADDKEHFVDCDDFTVIDEVKIEDDGQVKVVPAESSEDGEGRETNPSGKTEGDVPVNPLISESVNSEPVGSEPVITEPLTSDSVNSEPVTSDLVDSSDLSKTPMKEDFKNDTSPKSKPDSDKEILVAIDETDVKKPMEEISLTSKQQEATTTTTTSKKTCSPS